jgi:hypothetical protein
MEQKKGNFYITSLTNAKNLPPCDVKIVAVRFIRTVPKGWIYIQHLCPSETLLRTCKKIEKKGKWTLEVFNRLYRPNFLNEMRNDYYSKVYFNRIIQLLDEGKNVAFACFCTDYEKCHRGIIAEIIRARGYNVIII